MAITINESNNNIPVFVDNQVLRAADLNALANALQIQLRRQRVFNIGVGSIDLQKPQWNDDQTAILLAPGLAISSDGYELEVTAPCAFEFGRKLDDGLQCSPPTGMSSQCADKYRDLIEATRGGYELAEEAMATGWSTLSQIRDKEELEGKFCLVLIWCETLIKRDGCFNDCEARGVDQRQEIKAVLISRDKYAEVFPPQEENGESEGTNEVTITMPKEIAMCRFGFFGEGIRKKIDLCRIRDWKGMHLSFLAACKDAQTAIEKVYKGAYEGYYLRVDLTNSENVSEKKFTDDFSTHLTQLLKLYDLQNNEGQCPDIQYLYAYFRELILAYQEFATAADGLTVVVDKTAGAGGETEEEGNGVARCDFPGHVALGWPEGCPASPRVLPGTAKAQNERALRVKCLFRRLCDLVTAAKIGLPTLEKVVNPKIQQLRITPDIRREPFLSSRAIPFYYDINPAIWHCDSNPFCLTDQYTLRENNPLLFRAEPYDFYRIEGHYGMDLELANKEVLELRSCYNVSFDVLAVRIGSPALPASTTLKAQDLEDWYQNTRADILCKLAEYTTVPGTGGDDENPTSTPVDELRNYLEALSSLAQFPSPNFVPKEEATCCEYEIENEEAYLREELVSKYTAARDYMVKLAVEDPFRPRLDPGSDDQIIDVAKRYHRRRFETELQRQFHCFAHRHPGLEHLGGVPRGGTFVLVYKESLIQKDPIFASEVFTPAIRRTVVADFCLPYQCCGDAVIVRNEIQTLKLEISLDKQELCWEINEDGLYGGTEEISVDVAPSGGKLEVLAEGGRIHEEGKYTNVSSPIIVKPSEFNVGPAFKQGVSQLTFTYTVASGVAVSAVLEVFLQPTINGCEGKVRKTAVREEKTGTIIGAMGTLKLTPELDVRNLQNLRAKLPQGGALVLLEGGAVTEAYQDWFTIDVDSQKPLALVQIDGIPLLPEPQIVTIEAWNGGNCGDSCEIIVPDYCLKAAQFAIAYLYEYGPENDDGLPTVEVNQKNADVAILSYEELDPATDTGFIGFKIEETGMVLEAKQDEDGTLKERKIIIKKPIPLTETTFTPEKARYYLIYDLVKVRAYLNFLISDDNLAKLAPFTIDDLEENEIEQLDSPTGEFVLTYTNRLLETKEPLAECELTDLATLTVKISYKKTGGDSGDETPPEEGPDIPGNGGSPTPVEGGNDVIVVASTPTLSAAAGNLLNRRTTRYRETLMELRDTDNSIANSNGFKRTNLFLDTRDAASIDKAYMTALEATLKTRESTTAEREPLYTTVATVLTQAYLDKIVAIGDPVGAALTDGLQRLDQAGIDVKKIKRGWKAAELKKVIDKDRVEAVNKQIKA